MPQESGKRREREEERKVVNAPETSCTWTFAPSRASASFFLSASSPSVALSRRGAVEEMKRENEVVGRGRGGCRWTAGAVRRVLSSVRASMFCWMLLVAWVKLSNQRLDNSLPWTTRSTRSHLLRATD